MPNFAAFSHVTDAGGFEFFAPHDRVKFLPDTKVVSCTSLGETVNSKFVATQILSNVILIPQWFRNIPATINLISALLSSGILGIEGIASFDFDSGCHTAT